MSLVTFVAQYRDELIADLRMMSSIACPKCIIRYVDNEQEDACRTDCCQYEYEEPTPEERVLEYWMEETLQEMYRVGGVRLHEKWRKERFGDAYTGDVALQFDWILRHRDLYDGYDLEELGRILDMGVFARHYTFWKSCMTDAEYALLCSYFPE